MSLLRETCTIRTYTESVAANGTSDISLNTETSGVLCSFQQDVSAEVVALNRQRGRISGKCYFKSDQAISSDDRVYVRGKEWEVMGPPVYAPGATTQWVPLERDDD